jgi:type III pantothenate kinase
LNLIIDIGNTRVKAALYKGNHLFEHKVYPKITDLLSDKSFINQGKNAIIGSVVDELDSFYQTLNSIIPTLVFTSQTKIPLTNLYKSASTLGSDRLSASIGAYYLYPNANVLVIDAGTCIKYNFTNSKNEYLGGGISPGIQMKFKSLHQFTSKLPLVETDLSYMDLIGTNTENSILSGVLNGSVAEVDGIINEYKTQFADTICVLTGGDSELLAKRLKNSIFAHQNLVLKGLNDILNYTLENK